MIIKEENNRLKEALRKIAWDAYLAVFPDFIKNCNKNSKYNKSSE